MELDFLNKLDTKYDIYEDIYSNLLSLVLKMLKKSENIIVGVSLIDNEEIHKINREYRNIDRPTDVISFAFLDNDENLSGDFPLNLGEILISVPKAEEQAKEYGHSFEREMKFLFVHGILHLLGYDHMTPEDEKIMFDLQDKILDGVK